MAAMYPPREGTRAALALQRMKEWPSVRPTLGPILEKRRKVRGSELISPRLMWDLSTLYSDDEWTILDGVNAMELVPTLAEWPGRRHHLDPLCVFLNRIAESVYPEWLASADERAAKEAKVDKRPFRFLDLPAEIRTQIYDIVAADMHPKGLVRRQRIGTYWDHELLGTPLAQVNKQLRSEFLPRWFRIGECIVWGDSECDQGWLSLFGASRVPLMRNFDFQFGDDSVKVELQGAPASVNYDCANNKFFLLPQESSISSGQRIRVSSPKAWNSTSAEVRKLRDDDFESKFQSFVESLLEEDGDGYMHLTAEGLVQIIEYLQGMVAPTQAVDVSKRQDSVVM
ncbi:unnamed protein product [Zymoseptoria tritici ST99CH_3D7]|uniref:F-box domain-containing protein n=1 Tax=Zymoseptoria tritici (strain ST99CH_3D7) TaxID=1276538 RepID=A0A1X7S627_ZYMT9|nr:unnamed protein product [Zymoseptoria tritici ST99CH_3D7]